MSGTPKKKQRTLQLADARSEKVRPLATKIVDHLLSIYGSKREPLERGTRLAIMRSLVLFGPEVNLGGLNRECAINRVVEVLVGEKP